ncbi:sugar transferase [Nocardia seriolae]|uniref:Undecaprenyl-phosphate glucose phosphotransferase n=1 Tax=Nocardia seriolae TaxID=37332 RepID=A0ABC8AZK3_9NOCA|nr:sugar transferase [Nocardia seriolae]APA99416.1 Undecaprenyl-phosphate glucose phosphotransferase [Nocardia seriolae]MTJ63196.1 exopolysaccharide biosynthesis polyprenyl glycosylphosphotransferase [Nocardia seriolae]MTJ74842.1 exopolysaccharide biosynthesis polyprenyl glycosylphosphotransferase [Nocardia seriolae]MTJ89000.1 exopolysaccharide biosynthesis polyprenyl glycosylphosphotransferase [Nocardia seriolae]MTK32980.1 exopolysaccharide biosynthesis polyprenyl glycosylphosphotransferase [
MSYNISAGRAVRAARPTRPEPRSDRERWQADYAHRLFISDLFVLILSVGFAQWIRFGGSGAQAPLASRLPMEVRYTVVSVVLVLVWSATLTLGGTRSPRVIGGGAEEYRRLVAASLKLFGGIAIVSLLLKVDFARGYLAIALPLGMAGLMAERRLWRRWVTGRRARGDYRTAMLVVGSPEAARAMVAAFSRDRAAGYQVIGVCTHDDDVLAERALEAGGREIPVVANDHEVIDAVRRTGADTVAVTATDNLGPAAFRRMAWELDELGAELIVTPGLVDIAGTRLTHRVVADMPMLLVEKPQYDRAKSIRKGVFDFCFAAAALLAIAPTLAVIAAAVKLSSRGPIFYLSERIGRDGQPFRMIKFRSMYADAESHLNALIESNGGDPAFFRNRDDPRVTPVGRILRKYSLDELPQFVNVLRGEMSIVGPRPQVQREVDCYDGVTRRRLLVKPGVVGVWHARRRTDLTPEDAMRLDLSYVENWSMVLDLLLIAKTIGALTRGDTGY